MSTPQTAELLWGDRHRPKRGPKPSLSLERILTEAIALVDAEGLANLSMQRLAARLGYTKMSLYRYVPGRTELMALMLDYGIGAPVALPSAGAGEPLWRTRLATWALEIFARYQAHPWSTELTLGVRVFGPNEMGWLETALDALAGTGLTASERLDAVALLSGHVRNLVQQTAGTPTSAETEQQLITQLSTVLADHGARFPHTAAALAEAGRAPTRDNALRFGIDRILDGLAALIAARA